MKLSIGRIVLYRIAEHDIKSNAEIANNGVKAGDQLPAVVVRVWGESGANLRVLCDGPRDAWKTSVGQGDGEGQWQWPVRES